MKNKQWDFDYEKDVGENPDHIFNWVIAYDDGTKVPFRGYIDQAHEKAMEKDKRFSIEKADRQ